MPKITIIYRVCDGIDMLHTTKAEGAHEGNRFSGRFYDIPKQYLIKKCLSSVRDAINTTNRLDGDERISIEFICVYDNCTEDTRNFIKSLIPDAKMVCCEGNGNGDSFATCINIANNMVDDDTIVFFLEDDYSFLSQDGLIKSVKMLESVKNRNGRWCAMFLDDYPDRYDEDFERKNTTVSITPFGHLMKIDSSTCSFMTYVGVVKKHYGEFIKFREYPKVLEHDSVDNVWKTVDLYCPIPALTLHCQLKQHVPIYLNADSLKKIMES